jgi:alpha-N-arabinofuranosidase
MYRPHMGADSVPMRIKGPELTVPILDGSAKMASLSGSASVRDRRLCVTLTNPSLNETVNTRVRLTGGAQITEGQATLLTHEDMAATNTFDNPNQVALAKLSVDVSGDGATVKVPAQAVVALDLQLA